MKRHLFRRTPGAGQATEPTTRASGSQGAVALEMAIIAPLFIALVFGIIEVGGALKSYSSASNAVRAGGRMASVAGNDGSADELIMARVAKEAAGIDKGEIDYVIIWKATGPGQSPPASCISAAEAGGSTFNSGSLGVYDGGTGTAGACNVYMHPEQVGGPFDMAQGEASNPANYYYGCTGPSGSGAGHMLDCNWSPKNRKVQISPRGTTPASAVLRPDYLGVYIKATHDYYTGLFGTTLTITESGINLLEPDSFGVAT